MLLGLRVGRTGRQSLVEPRNIGFFDFATGAKSAQNGRCGLFQHPASTFTPVDGDAGRFLRATASYADAEGPAKSAQTAWDNFSIRTELQPGWNLIGWVEGDTPSGQLLQALPALVLIAAWDTETQGFRVASRGRYEQLPTLTTNMGLWLLIDGDEAVDWMREPAQDNVPVQLHLGLNLVAWASDGPALADAAENVGGAILATWEWNASSQHFRFRGQGMPDAAEASPALGPGDALWIFVSAPH